MANIITKTAEELSETDDLVIDELLHSSNVFIVLHPTEDKEDLNIVKELGNALNYMGNMFAYEELGGKGGGGCDLLPSLSDVIFYSVAFVVTTSATTFITELTKDIYKSTLKKLFDKKKNSSYEDGKFVLKLTTSAGSTITYYFQKYLTNDEFIEALVLVRDHFINFENSHKIEYLDFIFDRKENSWMPL
ncbi:MAG: hypothetical protein WC843_06100 [Candidatus Gracilibacteria bacterium]|jgi:hypothetical protein